MAKSRGIDPFGSGHSSDPNLLGGFVDAVARFCIYIALIVWIGWVTIALTYTLETQAKQADNEHSHTHVDADHIHHHIHTYNHTNTTQQQETALSTDGGDH